MKLVAHWLTESVFVTKCYATSFHVMWPQQAQA